MTRPGINKYPDEPSDAENEELVQPELFPQMTEQKPATGVCLS